jgi:hypothetical protein
MRPIRNAFAVPGGHIPFHLPPRDFSPLQPQPIIASLVFAGRDSSVGGEMQRVPTSVTDRSSARLQTALKSRRQSDRNYRHGGL